MTVESARKALAEAIAAAPATLNNHVLRGSSLNDAVITRFDLVRDMANDVIRDVLHAAENMVRKQFLAYDPSYQTSSSQVLFESLDAIPEFAVVDSAIRAGDVPEDRGGGNVVAMAHSTGVGANRLTAYRLKGSGIATKRAQGILLAPRDGIYRPVRGDILYYEPRFDALTVSGLVFFNAVTLVQTKLHAPDKARALARDTLKAVTAKIHIAGYADLEKAVMDDPTMRAKMAYVARRLQDDPGYAENLTTKKLVAFVKKHPEYGIATLRVDGHEALQFNSSPQRRHKIPRLLADDYLHSRLTGLSYEAGSKQDAAS
ncbi:MAG: hypothetical protein LBI84_06855 [Propionibacteriaceae bacterium]|jgi:hypothetical protein|nr:hypothetical protein [Propionibacteriaceae bacterium]